MSGVDDIYRPFIKGLNRPELEERVLAALGTLLNYGTSDGAHHKMWVIDQAVRALAGSTYADVIQRYEYPNGPNDLEGDFYEWDEGQAP